MNEEPKLSGAEVARQRMDREREARKQELRITQPRFASQRTREQAMAAMNRFADDVKNRKQQSEKGMGWVDVTPKTPVDPRTVNTLPSPAQNASKFNPSGKHGLPVEFYCWKDGEVATIFIMALGTPSPI